MRKPRERHTVRELIALHGFTTRYDEYGELVAENDVFLLRYHDGCDRIDLGVKAGFNKWGDSTDFSFRVPKTEKRWAEVLDAASADAAAGRYGFVFRQRKSPPRPKYVNRARRRGRR